MGRPDEQGMSIGMQSSGGLGPVGGGLEHGFWRHSCSVFLLIKHK